MKLFRIRWAVKVDGGIRELTGRNGDSLALDIKNEWANKEIVVMACVEGFNEKVSQRTMVGRAEAGTGARAGTLVRGVKAEGDKNGTAYFGQTITYKVTSYNKDKNSVGEEEKKRVKWRVKIGEKLEEQNEKGDSIEITMKEEWVGQKIIVMPYFNSPTEDVAAKTEVEKWDLPKILVETEQIEGKKENGDIARDMHFGLKTGSNHIHTDNFKLEQIDYMELRRAIEEDLKCNDAELFKRLKELVKYTSTGKLENANLALVDKMKELKSTIVDKSIAENPKTYSNETITKAVFEKENEKTKKFIEGKKGVITSVIGVIKKHNGNINKIEEIISDIEKPQYSTLADKFSGLTIAINGTWGHRATLTNYEYDAKSKKFNGKLKIRIFDHFGLDVKDIKRFGTAELVRKELPDFVTKVKDIPNSAPPSLIALLGMKEASIRYITDIAATGFRAWFILQHYRGYRPFINIMETEIAIEGQL